MAKFCTLASSSSGNCTYISASSGSILVDTGISCRRIFNTLADLGEDAMNIGAVLLTHEHIDHIKGLSVFLKKTKAEVYAPAAVIREAAYSLMLPDCGLHEIKANEPFEVSGMLVRAFQTLHDSRDSVGYRIVTPDEHTIAVATDLGIVTDDVEAGVMGAETVLLESNYDPFLLKMGPYPPHLKARIASDHGHLSNDDAAAFACRLIDNGTTRITLGHLSRENNNPALAEQTTFDALNVHGAKRGLDYELSVAPYDDAGRLVRL